MHKAEIAAVAAEYDCPLRVAALLVTSQTEMLRNITLLGPNRAHFVERSAKYPLTCWDIDGKPATYKYIKLAARAGR